MNTKLTLTVEKKVIAKAKSYAKKQNRSLSKLVENYFKERAFIGRSMPKKQKFTLNLVKFMKYMAEKDLFYSNLFQKMV